MTVTRHNKQSEGDHGHDGGHVDDLCWTVEEEAVEEAEEELKEGHNDGKRQVLGSELIRFKELAVDSDIDRHV